MLLRELTGAERVNFRRFFERGIRWLFPALALTELVTVAFTFQFRPPFSNQQQLGSRSQRSQPWGSSSLTPVIIWPYRCQVRSKSRPKTT